MSSLRMPTLIHPPVLVTSVMRIEVSLERRGDTISNCMQMKGKLPHAGIQLLSFSFDLRSAALSLRTLALAAAAFRATSERSSGVIVVSRRLRRAESS